MSLQYIYACYTAALSIIQGKIHILEQVAVVSGGRKTHLTFTSAMYAVLN